MSVIALPSTARAAAVAAAFHIQTADQQLTNLSGYSQVTTYPDRRWVARLEIAPKSDTELREWALALNQLAIKSNVFTLGPPYYTGPSTGYAGAGPVVNGASQTGTNLVVDGLDLSAAILSKGDFISFDTTSAGGETNRQLVPVTADVSSDGAGNATFPLAFPIRESPGDGVAVEINTPTAFFALIGPRGGIDDFAASGFGTMIIEAEERIWP